eukprot:EG_transcript_31861
MGCPAADGEEGRSRGVNRRCAFRPTFPHFVPFLLHQPSPSLPPLTRVFDHRAFFVLKPWVRPSRQRHGPQPWRFIGGPATFLCFPQFFLLLFYSVVGILSGISM